MSLIWPVTYSFNITLALGYIVLGIVLDCKPTPVPRLFIIGRKKKITKLLHIIENKSDKETETLCRKWGIDVEKLERETEREERQHLRQQETKEYNCLISLIFVRLCKY
jgi:hypothetical protein